MNERIDSTSDNEGNEIVEGDQVWVQNDSMRLRGIIAACEMYRVMVQVGADGGYVWAHISDVRLAA